MESNTSTIKWKVIYPIYMNSKKTIAEGRRLPVNKGVENPTAVELYEVCKYLGLPTELEADKAYPRDYTQRGRVKIQLQKPDNTFFKEELKTKKDVMIEVAGLIPKLQSRAAKEPVSTQKGKKSKKR